MSNFHVWLECSVNVHWRALFSSLRPSICAHVNDFIPVFFPSELSAGSLLCVCFEPFVVSSQLPVFQVRLGSWFLQGNEPIPNSLLLDSRDLFPSLPRASCSGVTRVSNQNCDAMRRFLILIISLSRPRMHRQRLYRCVRPSRMRTGTKSTKRKLPLT